MPMTEQEKQTLKEAAEALKEANTIMNLLIQCWCSGKWDCIDPCQFEQQMLKWKIISEATEEIIED